MYYLHRRYEYTRMLFPWFLLAEYIVSSCPVANSREFLVHNHVTRQPCWCQYKRIFSRRIYLTMEFISQRREMLLFFLTNIAVVASLTNQQ